MDLRGLKDVLLQIVGHNPIKMTPGDLEKAVAINYGLSRKDVRSVLKQLVAEENLTYTNQLVAPL